MKKLLGIIVLSLLLGGNAYAFGDFFLKGTTPLTLTEMGYKLFSVEWKGESNYNVLYTFTKDKSIVTCIVYMDHYKGEPSYNHRCFNITGLDRD